MEMAYRTNGPRGAEAALLEYLQELNHHESNRVKGVNFDLARALAHERLFLIYRKTGETNKMNAEYQRSIEHLIKHAQTTGGDVPTNITFEWLAERTERSERGLPVKWKTE